MEKRTLAFEIGTEEIPAFDLAGAVKQLSTMVPSLLDDAAIPHGAVKIFSSPRRLIVIAEEIPEATEEKNEVFKGPSAKIAFDAEGNPTKAAQGFARGKGVDPSSLVVEDGYVYARTHTPSVNVASLLSSVLNKIIHGLSWPRSQRWGVQSEYFTRPVRWIVALFGNEVIDFTFAGLVAGRTTYGHRFLAPGPFEVADADSLVDVVRSASVIPSEAEREQVIREGVAKAEAETGFTAVLHPKTLVEVINLAEYPTVLVGTFDEEFLKVPEEIIVDAMLVHQRYFPLYDKDGKLTNRFIVVSNGDPACAETIVDGNERVVRARLYDAKFFYDEDLKQPLESYVDHLGEVVFQEKLGTMLDKTNRIQRLADHLAEDAGLAGQDLSDVERAARLCKADLVTSAVVEFTSVQGVMGSYYAAASGETAQVAQAIEQHYRPRFAGDEAPDTVVGKIVAIADKLDTVCGLFAVGQGPTGSSDPFALRRSAIGIVAMLSGKDAVEVSLVAAIDAALASYAQQGIEFDTDAVRRDVIEFFITRTKVMMRDAGNSIDAIDAVLSAGIQEPVELINRVSALEAARSEQPEVFEDLATAYARANNLCDSKLGTEVNEGLLSEVEQALVRAVCQAESNVASALENNNYAAALSELAALRKPIDLFFENTMVMDEDQALRENRLRLLNSFVAVFANVADFALLSKVK
ncbi:MAG: glycine--tRNA ligase subunit beta [Eggerthellaceae bacterium]|jgi:glycyl-tRNA synthetase beta chain|nr:glycine--tRNA ligase subunit beta [Eggerthellaceae bacterium]